MEYEYLQNYPVRLNKQSGFQFNGFRLKGVLFGDIRSIHGNIGGVEFDSSILSKLLKNFLCHSVNVELVNILSRELNGFNWFEVYSTQVSELKMEDVMGKSEVAAAAASRYSNSIRSESSSWKFESNKVYSSIHEGIELFQPLNFEELDFFPIWWINGKRNNPKCELFCHFSILIHLLSKVFVEFKSQILNLAGNDIQLAVARDQTIEKYLDLSKEDLVIRLRLNEERNNKLSNENKSLKELVQEIRLLPVQFFDNSI